MSFDRVVQKEKNSSLPSKSIAIASTSNDNGNGNGNRTEPELSNTNYHLQANPNFRSEYPPLLFNSMQQFLPTNLLNVPQDNKYKYMRDVLRCYLTKEEHLRDQKRKKYRQLIISCYQPLYRELYTLNPTMFFAQSFLRAFNPSNENKEECIRSIISEPIPGVYAFDMLQPGFCEMLTNEVESMEKWAYNSQFNLVRPTTMNKFGIILDDFGMESMLERLRQDFIQHIAKIFFPDVGGHSLDSHHGFVVEYEANKDVQVDDSEVTLNVCLGKEFTCGGLFFKGVRCEKHKDTETKPEESYDYFHQPGRAIIHRGCHRHGARATTFGQRINFLMWCKSSTFRKIKNHQKEFLSCCGECQREKQSRLHLRVAAWKKELLFVEEDVAS